MMQTFRLLLFIKYSEEPIGLVCSEHRVDRVVKEKHLVNECKICDLVNSEQFDCHQQGQSRAEITTALWHKQNPSHGRSLKIMWKTKTEWLYFIILYACLIALSSRNTTTIYYYILLILIKIEKVSSFDKFWLYNFWNTYNSFLSAAIVAHPENDWTIFSTPTPIS